MLWRLLLGGCCYFVGSELPSAVYGKIVKDLLSFDRDLDRFLKNSIPAWTLIKTYWRLKWSEETAEPGNQELNTSLREIRSILERLPSSVGHNSSPEIRQTLEEIRRQFKRVSASVPILQGHPLDPCSAGGRVNGMSACAAPPAPSVSTLPIPHSIMDLQLILRANFPGDPASIVGPGGLAPSGGLEVGTNPRLRDDELPSQHLASDSPCSQAPLPNLGTDTQSSFAADDLTCEFTLP